MALETDSSAASVTEGASQPTTSGVSSGTASAAMLKAAEAASSPASSEGVTSHGPTTGKPQSQGDLQAAALAAAKQPATEGQPGVAAPADEPKLKARFDAVHGKGVTAGTAEVFKSVGLDATNPAHKGVLSQSVAIYRALTQDSMGFLHELANRLGVQLPTTKKPTAPGEDWPEAALHSEDGKGAYSDAQVREMLARQEDRILATVRGEMRPVSEFVGSEQETRQQNEAIAQATQTKDAILTRARQMPNFKENEAAIATVLREMDPAIKKQLGPAGALYEAYQTFVRENLPTLEASAEKSVRESFNRKAAAARGSVDPAGSGGEGVKVELNGPASLATHMEKMAERFTTA